MSTISKANSKSSSSSSSSVTKSSVSLTADKTSTSSPAVPVGTSEGSGETSLIGDDKGTTQHDVIGFISDGPVQAAEYSRPENLTELLKTMKAPEDDNHDIRNFLSRPVKIADIIWTGGTYGSYIGEWNIMDTINNVPCFRVAREKLNGFYGFTATAGLKVVVNAQPMECGIFQIGFCPMKKGHEDGQYLPMEFVTSAGGQWALPFSTGLPTKLVNIAKHSEAVLECGYVGPNLFLNLMEGSDFGNFFLQTITPLKAGTTGASCNISVYMYLKDVVLYGAARRFATQGPDDLLANISSMVPSVEATSEAISSVANLADQLGSIPLLSAVQPEAAFALKAGANLARQFGFSKPNSSANHERVALTPYGQPSNADGTSNSSKLGLSSDQGTVTLPFGVTTEDEMAIAYVVKQPNYLTNITWNKSAANESLLAWMPVNPNCKIWVGNDFFPTKLRYVSQMFQYWRGSINFTFHVAATKFHSGRLRFVLDLESKTQPTACEVAGYHYGKVVDIRDAMSFTINVPYFATTPWRQVPTKYNSSVASDWFITETSNLATQFTDNAIYVYVENFLRAPDNVTSEIDIAVYVSAGEDFELAGPMMTYVSHYNRWFSDEPEVQESAPEFEPRDGSGQYAPGVSGVKRERKKIIYKEAVDHVIISERGVKEMAADGAIMNIINHNEAWKKYPAAMSMMNKLHATGKMGPSKAGVRMKPEGPAWEDDIPTISLVSDLVDHKKIQLMASKITMGEKFVSLRQLTKRMQAVGSYSAAAYASAVVLPFRIPYSGNGNAGLEAQWSRTFLDAVMALYRYWRGGQRVLLANGNYNSIAQVYYSSGREIWDMMAGAPYGQMSGVYSLQNSAGAVYDARFMMNHPETTSIPVSIPLQQGVDLEFPFYSRFPFVEYRAGNNNPDAGLQEYVDMVQNGHVPTGIAVIGWQADAEVTVYRSAADDFSTGFILGAPVCRWQVSYNYH